MLSSKRKIKKKTGTVPGIHIHYFLFGLRRAGY